MRNVRCKLPFDEYVAFDMSRELQMIVLTRDSEIYDNQGYAIVNEPIDGRFRLQRGEYATRNISTRWDVAFHAAAARLSSPSTQLIQQVCERMRSHLASALSPTVVSV